MQVYWKTIQTLGSAALRMSERRGWNLWKDPAGPNGGGVAVDAGKPGNTRGSATVGHRFLESERGELERLLPGLDEKLAGFELEELERPGNPGISLLKEARAGNLLVPREYGGLGASPVEGLRVLRAIASRSPSLGIVCTMHNFSMCAFVEYAANSESYRMLLRHIAAHGKLLASGFAEGRSGARPLEMTMKARPGPAGSWILSGRKKPCTLSKSMDFLTAGVSVTDGSASRRGVALVPADSPGIERRPFWNNPVLAGAESDELILNDVIVPHHFVALSRSDDALDPLEELGYLWLQLALSASYVGIGSALVERVLQAKRGEPSDRLGVVVEIESAMSAVEAVARGLSAGEDRAHLLYRALSSRLAVQASLERSAMRCAELLGGMAFIGKGDVSYLLSATRALAFHPPGRWLAAKAFDSYLGGGLLDLS
jgi:alkylation response protein AidB-like acyl-CoA dehydrogenase